MERKQEISKAAELKIKDHRQREKVSFSLLII